MHSTDRPASEHRPTSVSELGYDRRVCATCGTHWPCPDYVKARCARMDLAHGLPCTCGWHSTDRPAKLTDLTGLRAECAKLVAERDLRYYDESLVTSTAKTAGERIRLAQREPLLDHDGAAVLERVMLDHAIPNMTGQELAHMRYVLSRFCPRRGAAL